MLEVGLEAVVKLAPKRIGAEEGARTPDLLLGKEAFYH